MLTGPNYEKLRTILLKKKRLLHQDVIKPIRAHGVAQGFPLAQMDGVI
jgi:hypothetical protein